MHKEGPSSWFRFAKYPFAKLAVRLICLERIQVENEYGSFGDDHVYLQYLLDGMRSRGLQSVVYFASNGPVERALEVPVLAVFLCWF
jgi:hypothetical protein